MRLFVFPVILLTIFLETSTSARDIVCPSDMVPTGVGTCIDRYEWPNKKGVKPLLGISGVAEDADIAAGRIMDVEQLCKSVGKRACKHYEWVKACQGPESKTYPFGNTLPKYDPNKRDGLCNYDKWFRVVDEQKVARRDPKEMDRLDQSEPSGERDTCKSSTGAMDMMGNAEEWVRCKDGPHGWCLMGRYWSSPEPCIQTISIHSPKWHYYQSSMRCCTNVQ